MTLQEIENSTKNHLIPSDIAELLDCDPHSIRVQAQTNPNKLGFPVVVIGSRVKIPRQGFLFYWKYGRLVECKNTATIATH